MRKWASYTLNYGIKKSAIAQVYIFQKEPNMPITDALPDMKRELRFFPAENEHPKTLTATQIDYFNAKGFLSPLDVFSPEEAVANRVYFDDIMTRAETKGYNSYAINGWHHYCRGIYDLAMEPRILDYAQDLVGENLVCEMTHYFSKLPGDSLKVSWHQDASYWPLTPSKVVTVWLAIDDVDQDNGPMTVIPGSHIHGQIPFEHSAKEDKNVLAQTVKDPYSWGDPPVPFTMKAGQISMHTDLLLHGSELNTSDRRRCGLTIRYMPPDVRGRHPSHDTAIICQGADPSNYWQHIPRPDSDRIPPKKR